MGLVTREDRASGIGKTCLDGDMGGVGGKRPVLEDLFFLQQTCCWLWLWAASYWV